MRILILVVSLGWFTLPAEAETGDSSALRQQFLEAERVLRSGQRSKYERLLAELEEYPLYPYLIYQDLRARLANAPASEIRSFLDEWDDVPLASRLRSVWLEKLASDERWHDYLEHYIEGNSVARRCDYLNALIRTGRAEEVFPQVDDLWLQARSQPDECDPVFSAWRAAGHLEETLAWARVRLAIDAGETGLARYLRRFVVSSQRADVDRWIATRKDPAGSPSSSVIPRKIHSRSKPWSQAFSTSREGTPKRRPRFGPGSVPAAPGKTRIEMPLNAKSVFPWPIGTNHRRWIGLPGSPMRAINRSRSGVL